MKPLINSDDREDDAATGSKGEISSATAAVDGVAEEAGARKQLLHVHVAGWRVIPMVRWCVRVRSVKGQACAHGEEGGRHLYLC